MVPHQIILTPNCGVLIAVLTHTHTHTHTITALYNECLKRGHFPEQRKIAKIIPITKPGKKDSCNPSKYCPISLINIEGKVLEQLLINGIMHHLYKTKF